MPNRIFIKYRRREYFHNCPLCMAPIKWATDGISWYPCDDLPVLYIPESGYEEVLKKRDLIKNVKIIRTGMNSSGKPYEYGLEPHYFTCKEVKRVFTRKENI